ncbi:lipopolysaccharide core biosynthesis KdoIII attachment protein, partial [Escherichia coli DEC2A]
LIKNKHLMMLLFFFLALHRKKHLCQHYEQRILLLSIVLRNIC